MHPPVEGANGAADDVRIVWWPEEEDLRSVGPSTTPRLLLVAPDAEPPDKLGPMEDWVRLPLDPVEFAHRRDALLRREAARPPVTVDDDGLVRRGTAWVALSSLELALFRSLFENAGRVVSRAELRTLAQSLSVATDPRLPTRYVSRLRDRVRPLGVEIHPVRRVGYMLIVD